MSDERASRPELERDRPIRSFSNLWTEAAARSTGNGQAEESISSDTAGFIENGVRNAYSVVDRYLNEGQRIASEFGQSYADIGLGERGQEFQARWLQLSGELIANWFDLLGLLSENLIPEGGLAAESESPGEDNQCHPVLEVESARPVRIDARMAPGAHRYELADGEVRDKDSNAPPIPFIALSDPDACEVTVRAQIPADQPVGSYKGNVANRVTGEILGTLTLDVR